MTIQEILDFQFHYIKTEIQSDIINCSLQLFGQDFKTKIPEPVFEFYRQSKIIPYMETGRASRTWKEINTFSIWVRVKFKSQKSFKVKYYVELRNNDLSVSFSCYNPIFYKYIQYLDCRLKSIDNIGLRLINPNELLINKKPFLNVLYELCSPDGAKKKYAPLQYVMDICSLQNELILCIAECELLKPHISDFIEDYEIILGKKVFHYQSNLTERDYYSKLSYALQVEYSILDRIGILIDSHLSIFKKGQNVSLLKAIDYLKSNYEEDSIEFLEKEFRKIYDSMNAQRRDVVHKNSIESEILFKLLLNSGNEIERKDLNRRFDSLSKKIKNFPKSNMKILEHTIMVLQKLILVN